MSKVPTSSQVPKPVLRSLYRSLLKEVKVLDTSPVLKVLMPIPPKFQPALGMTTPLYVPSGRSYSDLVRSAFRSTQKPDPTIAFEALSRVRMHISKVSMLLPVITKGHVGIMAALEAEKGLSEHFHAKLADIQAPQPLLLPQPTPTKGRKSKSNAIKATPPPPPAPVETNKLKIGMGLIAHPLSSAHVDRRVMLVVDVNPAVTTAVVLDMRYTFPLSSGNPMFPEVLWGHNVYSGGYYHVDFTMPPTANVAVLHTLEPTSADSKEHALFCKPVIEGETKPDGTKIPTLYYSKTEALPYLATLCPGQLRSAVRVYWGVMKWPTPQIQKEVEKGHWMPVEVSANFFGAYPFTKQQPTEASRFPTEENLRGGKEDRIKAAGGDLSIPQTYAPNPMLWGRESLWDQILFAMGGEFKQFVGTVNPFSNPQSDFGTISAPNILADNSDHNTTA